MHPAALEEPALLSACRVERTRRSGPGGQHRNKVETAIIITHTPSGVAGEASERRSQAQNRARAIQRLRVNLALQIREPLAGAIPSALWSSRVSGGRISVNQDHSDFPVLLAESLDVLAAESGDFGRTARRLNITSSQLVKLLQLEPRALQRVNSERVSRGLHRLR